MICPWFGLTNKNFSISNPEILALFLSSILGFCKDSYLKSFPPNLQYAIDFSNYIVQNWIFNEMLKFLHFSICLAWKKFIVKKIIHISLKFTLITQYLKYFQSFLNLGRFLTRIQSSWSNPNHQRLAKGLRDFLPDCSKIMITNFRPCIKELKFVSKHIEKISCIGNLRAKILSKILALLNFLYQFHILK